MPKPRKALVSLEAEKQRHPLIKKAIALIHLNLFFYF